MSRLVGAALVAAAVILIPLYAYLMLLAPEELAILAIRYTVFAAVLIVSVFLAAVGYAVLRAPRASSIDEIRREVEEEIRRLRGGGGGG